MGYWTEVKDIVLKGVNLAVDEIKDTTERAIEKSKDGITYAQLKKDLFFEQRKLHDLLADLGDAVRDLYRDKKDIYTDVKIQEIMAKVITIEETCKKMETEMKSLGQEKEKPAS